MDTDRRQFLTTVSALAAGASFLGSTPKAHGQTPPAQASQAAMGSGSSGQAPGYYRTKIGQITVTALLDGGMQLQGDYLLGAQKNDLSAAQQKFFLPKGPSFPTYVNAFLIEVGEKKILIDTGAFGASPTVGHLRDTLKASGINPNDISEVILTHAHPDHINGLLDGEGNRVFSKATVKISAQELAFWLTEDNQSRHPEKSGLFKNAAAKLSPYKRAGQIETFSPSADLGHGLAALPLPGHTPGHSGVVVSDGAARLVIWTDLVHIPSVQLDNPEVSIVFDIDPEAARRTRKKCFEEVARDGTLVAGMHMVFPGIGHLDPYSQGKYAFLPQPWDIWG